MGRTFAFVLCIVAPVALAGLGACSPRQSSSGAPGDAAAEAGSDAEVGAHGGEGGQGGEGGEDAAGDTATDASFAEDAGDAADDAPFDAAAYPVSASIRVANWSPDAPAFDVCTSPHGTNAFAGPLVAGLVSDDSDDAGPLGVSGIPFPLVTQYFLVAPGAYDVRFVAAGSTSCGTPILPDTTTPTIAASEAATVALIGDAAVGGGPLGLRPLSVVDEIIAIPNYPLRMRFINVAPSMSVAALGTGSLGMGNFDPMFPAAPYGEVAPLVEADAAVPGIDDNGYCRVPNLLGTTLSVSAPGATTDTVATMPVYTQDGIPVTIVAVGGTPSVPVSLLECLDSAGAAGGGLSECFLLP